MFQDSLPESVDPRQLAEQRRQLRGEVSNRAMPRLAEVVGSDSGRTEAEIQFDVGERRRPEIRGRARTEVELTCQRCMQSMQYPLEAEFDLIVVESDAEAESLPPERDPLVASKSTISIAALLEDELILALPIIALHPEGSPCEAAAKADAGAQAAPERKNPFAVLASLKRND